MLYKINNRTITIPDKDIENFMKRHELSENEAIQLWLEDNDYLENETVNELTEKAKTIRHYEQSATKERKKTVRERKVDEEKGRLLNILINAINQENCVDSIKNEAEFSFNCGENSYTVKLIKHRPPKK